VPNPKNWGFEHGMVRNHEAQWYQPDNAKCGNGTLVITAERVVPSKDKGNAEYTSSSLTSQGLREFQYGTFEMRAKVDVSSGSWPAWWTLGVDTKQVGWPSCGEVDIMEYYRTLMHGNIMYATSSGQPKWSTKTITVDEAWAASFHNW
jgi:beta-glucanase (GH16 family)